MQQWQRGRGGKERDECLTSMRLCLLNRIDAHVETSITRGLDSTFLEKCQLPIYCESIQAAQGSQLLAIQEQFPAGNGDREMPGANQLIE